MTEAQAGKLHIRQSIEPTEQQMRESADEAGECLALCGGSAITRGGVKSFQCAELWAVKFMFLLEWWAAHRPSSSTGR